LTYQKLFDPPKMKIDEEFVIELVEMISWDG